MESIVCTDIYESYLITFDSGMWLPGIYSDNDVLLKSYVADGNEMVKIYNLHKELFTLKNNDIHYLYIVYVIKVCKLYTASKE